MQPHIAGNDGLPGPVTAPFQRRHFLTGKLARFFNGLPLRYRQRIQHPVKPRWVRGHQHNPIRIGQKNLFPRTAPAVLQLGQVQFDGHNTDDFTVDIPHRIGDKIARKASGGPNPIEPPLFPIEGCVKIGPKTIGLANKTGLFPSV